MHREYRQGAGPESVAVTALIVNALQQRRRRRGGLACDQNLGRRACLRERSAAPLGSGRNQARRRNTASALYCVCGAPWRRT